MSFRPQIILYITKLKTEIVLHSLPLIYKYINFYMQRKYWKCGNCRVNYQVFGLCTMSCLYLCHIFRIVELFVTEPFNPYWGVLCKSLAYSKAACDPFVYSLLRHQYRKTCSDIINRLMKRSSLNDSRHQQENGEIGRAKEIVKDGEAKVRPTDWGLLLL